MQPGNLERETKAERATYTLARKHLTKYLLPLSQAGVYRPWKRRSTLTRHSSWLKRKDPSNGPRWPSNLANPAAYLVDSDSRQDRNLNGVKDQSKQHSRSKLASQNGNG